MRSANALAFRVVLLMLAGAFTIGLSVRDAAAQDTATIVVEPVALDVGQTVAIAIQADCGAIRCTAFEIELNLNPEIVEIQSVTLGDYFGSDGLVIENRLDPISGTLAYSATVLGATSDDAGDVLLELVILARSTGRTEITFTRLSIGDLTPLQTSVRSGTIRVTAPEPTPTTVPTRAPAPTATLDQRPRVVNALPVVESYHPGSISNAVAYESVWADLEFDDIKSPGLVEYEIDVSAGQRYRWVFVWCGDNRTHLEGMLDVMSVGFFIDNVPASGVHEYSTVARCRGWVTILNRWQPNETAVLEIRYRLDTTVTTEDGTYQPGSYVQRIYARVR